MPFPKDFVWGAATASYQIEGGVREGGRTPSVWDDFCHTPGKIANRDTGDVACDSYHRYEEDIRIMKELGIKAYRFSLSWTRILPHGVGEVNQAGVDYYNRVIDKLLENGIEPYVTLFHWDYPLELYYKGGWLNRESADWFAEYAAVAARCFSDRVKYWFTSNESQCYIGFGHQFGTHAPGLDLPAHQACRAWHHNLLALGKAAKALRENARGPIQVWLVSCGYLAVPQTNSQEDIQAARNLMFNMRRDGKHLNFSYGDLLDPAVLGTYPEKLHPYLPEGWQDDMKTICQPLDMIGANVYTGSLVRAVKDPKDYEMLPDEPGTPRTGVNKTIRPACIYWSARFLTERYHLPVYITENGLANTDCISLDGKCHDPQRADYIDRYLGQLSKAIGEGADVRGYFYWSLLDNFEWSEGFTKRFGLAYVDYATCRRTVKDSAYHYREIIQTNGAQFK